MNIETVKEHIQSLESAGELSIKERKYLELAKAYLDVAAENVAIREQSEEVYAAGYNHGHLNTVDGIAYAGCVKDDFYSLALQVMAEVAELVAREQPEHLREYFWERLNFYRLQSEQLPRASDPRYIEMASQNEKK